MPLVIKQTSDRLAQIIVERYHRTISVLNNTMLGFDLLVGTTLEQAKTAVALLNENTLERVLNHQGRCECLGNNSSLDGACY